jgi:hypothetical protein
MNVNSFSFAPLSPWREGYLSTRDLKTRILWRYSHGTNSSFLENLKLEGKQSHLNLMIFPSLARDAGEPDYLALEEA